MLRLDGFSTQKALPNGNFSSENPFSRGFESQGIDVPLIRVFLGLESWTGTSQLYFRVWRAIR